MVCLFSVFIFTETENGDENVFSLIFENIFSENENRKQPKNENNKILFSVFSVSIGISFWVKWKWDSNECNFKQI